MCFGSRLGFTDGQEFLEIDLLRVQVCDQSGPRLALLNADITADIALPGGDLQLIDNGAIGQVGKVTGQ